MAATKHKKIAGLVAAATSNLLAPETHAAAYENDWEVDTSYLTYQEEDRVQVDSLIAMVKGKLSDEDQIKLDLVLDTMTGSTPTGALSNSNVVSVSGTSGGGGFSAGGQALALAPFDDTRLSVNFNWLREYSRAWRGSYTGYVSVESDHESFGGSIKFLSDSESRQSTWTMGIGGSADTASQTGGNTPDPLSRVEDERFFGEGKRNSVEAIFGFSHVLNSRTVGQINMSYGQSMGYHTDPYKVISIANANDIELERVFESRPDNRTKKIIYTDVVHSLPSSNSIRMLYRWYSDNWGVASHTLQYGHRFNLENAWWDSYIEPSLRLYQQSEADFYVRTLPIGQALPSYASADNRLAKMTGITLSVKYGMPLGDKSKLRLKMQYVDQSFKRAIFDENKAFVFNISYKKAF